MYQASHPFFDRNERAVFIKFNYNAGHEIIFFIFLFCFFPWVFTKRLNGEGNFAVLYFYYFGMNFFTNLKQRFRVFHQTPINFGNMNEPLKTLLNLQKDAEINDSRDSTVN